MSRVPSDLKRERVRKSMGKLIDLTGQRFGRLVVLKRAVSDNHGAKWFCRCDCGNTLSVRAYALRSGHTVSCGCYRLEQTLSAVTTHAESGTKLHKVWRGIKWRCYDVHSPVYKYYGARGIIVCDEWIDNFENFRDWALANGYQEGLSIDRINVDGDYSPQNCRWGDAFTQMNNTRRNHFMEFQGEIHSVSEWSRLKGISVGCLFSRLRRGWSVERTLTEPARDNKRK